MAHITVDVNHRTQLPKYHGLLTYNYLLLHLAGASKLCGSVFPLIQSRLSKKKAGI